MTGLVVDSSVILAWALPDEVSPSAQLEELVLQQGAIAPAHWPLEIVNTLQVCIRRDRINNADFMPMIADICLLPIELDLETPRRAWGETAKLASSYGLTIYDAAYLELAARLDLPLATFDRPLAAAARQAGVKILS